MPRASIDITGAGPHTIVTPGAMDRILLREVYLTFAHDQPQSLKATLYFDARLVAGPFYFSDGGDIRYRKDASPNTYQGQPGESVVIALDPNLSAAGFIDYEVGSW